MMRLEIGKLIVADTGFWYALYNNKEIQRHSEALKLFENMSNVKILFPWPILYEVLRSQFVKNKNWTTEFQKLIRSSRIIIIDDSPYRDEALNLTFTLASSGKRNISLVDMVLRKILEDPQYKIHSLITFNQRDFYDICKRRLINITPNY